MTPEEQEQIYRENMESLWTPYNLEVLLHHYASGAPFPRELAPAYPECISTLRHAGLMELGSKRLTFAGGRFVVALCNLSPGNGPPVMRTRLAKAIRDALLADHDLPEGDRTRTAEAAIYFYERAKKGHEPMQGTLAEIIGKAMAMAPGECGCVGPEPGQKHCRCRIYLNATIAKAVEQIREHFGTPSERDLAALIGEALRTSPGKGPFGDQGGLVDDGDSGDKLDDSTIDGYFDLVEVARKILPAMKKADDS